MANKVTVTANNDFLNKPLNQVIPSYNMGTVNVGGTPTVPTATKTDLNTFNQQMVQGNTTPTITTPTVPANTTPTTDKLSPYYDQNVSYLSEAAKYAKQQADTVIPTEEEARANALKAMQAEIDATNTLYADKLRRAQLQGAGLLGQTGAIQARRGLLGSDFGTAQTQTVQAGNEENYRDIENEKLVKINQIQTKAKEDATAAMEAKRLAKAAGLKDYVSYLTTEKTAKETALGGTIQDMLANNIDLANLNDSQIEEIAKSYGVSKDKFKSTYNQAKATKTATATKLAADQARDSRFTLGKDQVAYQINPLTGKPEQIAMGMGDTPVIPDVSQAQPWLAQYNSGAMDLNDIYTKIGSSKEAQPIKNELARLIAAQGGKRVIPMDDAQIAAINDQIKNIDDLLKDGGYNYKVISGPIQGGLFGFGGRITGAKGDALGIARNLVSNQTLQALADAKAKGITFGALSEAELNAVANSASRIASKLIKNGENIVGFEGTEDEFKKDLEAVRDGLIKAKTKKTGGTGTQTPEQDNVNYTNLLNTNKDQVSKNEEIFRSQFGRYPENATEYFQVFPEDNRQSFNNVVGDTNLSQGVVSGVNITSYATDPQHEQKIASIVQKIPDPTNFDYDAYIKSIAPSSKITGDMIKTASSTYGVDPRLVVAIIQNDSRFGTLGHGATNNNPGNIGQFDNLKTTAKGYPTMQDGVLAVGKWLANHKTTA